MTQSSTGETLVCSQGQFSRAMLLLNTTRNSYTITPSKNAHAPYFGRKSPPRGVNSSRSSFHQLAGDKRRRTTGAKSITAAASKSSSSPFAKPNKRGYLLM